jgi:hypothetical protein
VASGAQSEAPPPAPGRKSGPVDERGGALHRVVGLVVAHHHEVLEHADRLAVGLEAPTQRQLRPAERQRALVEERLDELIDPGVEFGFRHREVGEPPLGGFGPGEQLAAPEQLLRFAHADDPRNRPVRPGATEQSALQVVVADLRLVGDDRHVAPHHHLEATRDREPVHHRDRRLRDQPVVAQRQEAGAAHDPPAFGLVAERLARQLLQVAAGAERPPPPADQDRPHLVVGARRFQCFLALAGERVVDRVQRLRPVQPDRRHPTVIAFLVFQRLVVHGSLGFSNMNYKK